MFKKSYCFLRLINVSNSDEYKRSLEFRGFTLIRDICILYSLCKHYGIDHKNSKGRWKKSHYVLFTSLPCSGTTLLIELTKLLNFCFKTKLAIISSSNICLRETLQGPYVGSSKKLERYIPWFESLNDLTCISDKLP